MNATRLARLFSPRLLGLSLGLLAETLAHAESGPLRLTCTSLLLRPATMTFGTSECRFVVGTGLFSETSEPEANATNDLVLAPGGSYSALVSIVRDNKVIETEELTLQMPLADTNGNLLPDHLELERSTALAVAGLAQSRLPGGTNYTVTGALSRQAGTAVGTYTLAFVPASAVPTPTNPNPPLGPAFTVAGEWSIFGFDPARTRLVYQRTPSDHSYRLELAGLSPETSDITMSSGRVTLSNGDKVALNPIVLSDVNNRAITFGQAELSRQGIRYIGSTTTSSNVGRPPLWPSPRTWLIEFTDPNDSDNNGVPEFSDPGRFSVGVTLNRTGLLGGLAVGDKLTLTATTHGRPSTIQWYRDGVLIPGEFSASLTVAALLPATTPTDTTTFALVATTDTGVTASDEFRLQVSLPRSTLILAAVAAPGALVSTSDPFNPLLVGPNAVTFHSNLPDAVRLELGSLVPSSIPGAELTLMWRADFTLPSAPSGIALKLVALGGQRVAFHLHDPTGALLARAEGTMFDPLVIEDDGLGIRILQRNQRILSASTATRRGHQLGIVGAPDASVPQFAPYRTIGLRAWPAPWLLPRRTARAVNLSTLGFAGVGDRALIGGMGLNSDAPRTILLRAVGPELRRFGVGDASAEIRLGLFAGTALQAENSGWSTGSDPTAIAAAGSSVGAFALTPGHRDSALLRTLPSGTYTVQASGTGTGMIEIYDTQAADTRAPFANLSTRGFIAGPGQPLIAGLAVRGDSARIFLLRAIGPALRRHGLTGPISDPRLVLYDETGKQLGANDDWIALRNVSALDAVFLRVGAFPLQSEDTKEAALLVRLPAGNYTVHVLAGDGQPGLALVEIYDVVE
jgi:hypothetical protein